jgi:hypothetical protein
MAKDLNGTEAVEDLIEYSLQLLKLVSGSEIKDDEWKNISTKPLIDEYGVALCGDGNPTFIMNNLIKKKEEEYAGKIAPYFGGFHLVLEGHRKRGSLFGKSHMEDFFSSWRTSEGQLKWVLNPGDPNQIDTELGMYVLGIYVSAVRAVIKHKGPGTAFSISSSDVVDHMIQRAKEFPIVMIILIEIRYAEVIFMLHQSEKESDVSKFLTAMKFLSPMFASSHATKYVNMTADFLVEWYCKSDAEKVSRYSKNKSYFTLFLILLNIQTPYLFLFDHHMIMSIRSFLQNLYSPAKPKMEVIFSQIDLWNG